MEAPESVAVIRPPGEITELEGVATGSSLFFVGEEKVGKKGKSPPSLCSDRKLWFESESEDMAAQFFLLGTTFTIPRAVVWCLFSRMLQKRENWGLVKIKWRACWSRRENWSFKSTLIKLR
jgi:hypothetical protein